MKTSEVWKRNSSLGIATIAESTTIENAYDIMKTLAVHHLVVTQAEDIVGIISTEHLLMALMQDHNAFKLPVSRFMVSNPPQVDETTNLQDAIAKMQLTKLTALPIVKNNQLSGILTQTDLVRLLEKILFEKQTPEVQRESKLFLANPLVQSVMKLMADIGI